jgi:hypothetical protein
MNTLMEKELEDVFSFEIRKDVDRAYDLYRALCNNVWERDGHSYSFTWRSAGEVVSAIRNRSGCPHEDYMDYYLSGQEGYIAPWLEHRLNILGYTTLNRRP